jgi:hypothetical protein
MRWCQSAARPGGIVKTGRWRARRQMGGKRIYNWRYLLDWEAEAHGARCDVNTFEDLGLRPLHHGSEIG